jgi:riboflavin synthase
MFTGIITHIGKVENIVSCKNHDLSISISIPNQNLNRNLDIGCSISCCGICLTLTKKTNHQDSIILSFEVSQETVEKTNISHWAKNQEINLEFSLRAGDELGGHLVSGHIDNTALINKISQIDDSYQFLIGIPPNLEKFICQKGSITLDGVSLTVNEVTNGEFSVNIIKHTFENTNFHSKKIGDRLNLEIDNIARYLQRLNNTK